MVPTHTNASQQSTVGSVISVRLLVAANVAFNRDEVQTIEIW